MAFAGSDQRGGITGVINISPRSVDQGGWNNLPPKNDSSGADTSAIPFPSGPSWPGATDQSPSGPFIAAPVGPSAAARMAQVQNAAKKRPDVIAANAAVDAAQAAYDSERKRILAAWRAKPENQAAMNQLDQASADLEAARSPGKPQLVVLNAAARKLSAENAVTHLQEQAVASDPTAVAAKNKMAQAVTSRDELWKRLIGNQ
jgi:hypothetical protein